MEWEGVTFSSAAPFISYNFLRDLEPEALERLDVILKLHLDLDERRAATKSNGKKNVSPSDPVLCRYDGCSTLCISTYSRGQHERQQHGKALKDG